MDVLYILWIAVADSDFAGCIYVQIVLRLTFLYIPCEKRDLWMIPGDPAIVCSVFGCYQGV